MNSKLLRIAAAAAMFALAPSAFATAAEDAQVLIGQGQYPEALKLLDQQLSKNPQDAEARFTRGLVLVRLNRGDEAIKVFADLTRDYPQLPEPYNNLAVLYAQQGDYEKARDALEAALATHPSYATAHENLGDIYAALAGAAYNRALMLDQSNQTVRNKLNLVSQLDRAPSDPSAVIAAAAPRVPATPVAPPMAAPAAPVAPKPVAPAPVVVAAAPKPATPPPAAPVAAPVAPAAPAVVAAPATPAKAPASADPAGDAVLNAVYGWAQAWSQKDTAAYFAAYADDFVPEGGLTRKAWEAQRKDRISRPKKIKVAAQNPQIAPADGGVMRVNFTQAYESDSFSDSVNKVLELKFTGGAWKITREYTR